MHTPSHPNDPTPTNTDAVYLLVAVLRLLRRGSGRSGWGTYLVCCLAGGGGLDEDILGVHNSVHILLLLQQPV